MGYSSFIFENPINLYQFIFSYGIGLINTILLDFIICKNILNKPITSILKKQQHYAWVTLYFSLIFCNGSYMSDANFSSFKSGKEMHKMCNYLYLPGISPIINNVALNSMYVVFFKRNQYVRTMCAFVCACVFNGWRLRSSPKI